jgi:hypothetical protein
MIRVDQYNNNVKGGFGRKIWVFYNTLKISAI